MGSATELWHTLEHAIVHYTGLSTATFFTVLAVAVALYHVVSGWFAAPPPPPRKREVELEQMEPLPPPVQLGEITGEELSAYDGSDPKKPLLMAIKGEIYDVTQSRMFYGPGGPYALFAGKDASRALAKMSFEQKDLTGDISGLGPFELEALQDWEYKFMSKYVKVGTVKKTVPVTDGSTSEATEASTQTTEEGPAESPAEHSAESKEDALAAHVKSEEGIIEPKEDAPAAHVKSEEDIVEPKEDAPAAHVKSEEDIIEPKEVGVAEDTKE